jgi:hypothetical protein
MEMDGARYMEVALLVIQTILLRKKQCQHEKSIYFCEKAIKAFHIRTVYVIAREPPKKLSVAQSYHKKRRKEGQEITDLIPW